MSVTARLPVLVAAALLATAAGLAAFVIARGGSGSKAAEVVPAQTASGGEARTDAAPRTRPARPASRRAAADPTVPGSVSRALARNRVVVVSLFAPGSGIDSLARAEARNGALAAGVAFVPVNVLAEPRAVRFAQRLGVFGSPALLVLRKGTDVRTRIDGYADEETVAQAAANAAR